MIPLRSDGGSSSHTRQQKELVEIATDRIFKCFDLLPPPRQIICRQSLVTSFLSIERDRYNRICWQAVVDLKR